ncbi:multiple C2 and transmembrane domain-containing protein 1-like isoform X5 [Ostrea edulis]|uniref:multiple C2 and transmembrane domain-containing protein 1-like isoform X5 n=1 Tax=Ostrea edulis TaxID=37623 RepID=UPI0024AF63CD|nr:multiple C2 and transmembrane domain-containing protein 1-like isoform X5 [Ostrea edulis]
MSSSEEDNVLSSATAIMMRHDHKDKWYKKVSSHVKGAFTNRRRMKRFTKSTENLSKILTTNTRRRDLTGSLLSLPGLRKTEWSDTESSSDVDSLRECGSGHRTSGDSRYSDRITEHDSVSQVDIQVTPAADLGAHHVDPCFDTHHHHCSSHSLCVPHDDSDASDISDVENSSRCGSLCDTMSMSSVDSLLQDTSIRQRKHELMQHSFFHLDVWLKEGKDLVIRDSSGTSDPYVKFKIGSKQFYKSRTVYKNLNPKWDEKFTIPIEDAFKPVSVKCYDYDRGVSDDRMGSAEIDLSTFDLNTPTELKLELKEKKDEEYMGYILLQCTLIPKSGEEKEQFHQTRGSTLKKSAGSLESQARKLKMQIWSGIVNIVLVEGQNLMAMDDNGLSDPYVKFRLGQEKYKSKHKFKTLNPRWLEQFSLRIFDDQSRTLDISVYDHDLRSDDFMGRATIDLSGIEKEKTHTIVKELEDGAGTIKLLLTISGTQGAETITDLINYTTNTKERDDLYRSYGVVNSFKNLKDIGWLQVKVIKAQGLMAADIGGKSDPFCVLELVNARLQTQTEYKTLNPDWNKVFTFNVKDIHSVLEVTVYDEDRDKKSEFLGKVAIPILLMKRGIRRWYALKDKKLMGRAKGAVLLEMDFVYNPVKAAIRTVNPREEKYMQPEPKFKISLMKRNINRVTQIVSSVMEVGKFLQSCFEWESKARSITAFTVFLIITWFFEPYMLPVTLLILFLKNYLIKSAKEAFSVESKEEVVNVDDDDDDEEDEASKDEKKSVREKFQAAQEVCLQVQQGMDMVASLGERVKNTFNWTVPWLSMLAVIVLTIGVLVLYHIPIRVLILLWGINKFTKKLRAPNAIPNNELLDFLSRVPSDSELIQFREFTPDVANLGKKKRA